MSRGNPRDVDEHGLSVTGGEITTVGLGGGVGSSKDNFNFGIRDMEGDFAIFRTRPCENWAVIHPDPFFTAEGF